jgi:integrase
MCPFGSEATSTTTPAATQRATVSAGLGLRQGEVFGLAVEDVDFLRGTVQVRRQFRLHSDGRIDFRSPKGAKARSIPLPASIRDALAAYLAAYPAWTVSLSDDTAEGQGDSR